MMPTESERCAMVSDEPSKVLGLLRKRLRQLRQAIVVLAACVALAATALGVWWLNCLNGLPDIGDPFDVAAFRAFTIPDDQNAFALWRRANQMVTVSPLNADFRDPKLRDWVEANRPAVEMFVKAAECPDATSLPPDVGEFPSYAGFPIRPTADIYEYPVQRENPGLLISLTTMEGDRRRASGDAAGAWDCYRAVLRMMVHVQRRGRLTERNRANLNFGDLRHGVETWAADRRTTIAQLRRALAVVVECRPSDESNAYTLKLEYLDFMRFLDGPVDPPLQQIEHELTYRVGGYELPTESSVRLYRALRRLRREPDRSRRVVRLLFANWLAQVEPGGQRPRPPAVQALIRPPGQTAAIAILLYPVSPEAPAGARALAPREVARWLVTTNDARLGLVEYNGWTLWTTVRRREQRAYRELLVALASELFRRERGALPPNDEALVGTYLQSLPDDGSAGSPDEATPTVE